MRRCIRMNSLGVNWVRGMYRSQSHTGDVAIVEHLLAEQFPEWSLLAVRPFDSNGTDNALFLLGDRMVGRFPLLPSGKSEMFDFLSRVSETSKHVGERVALEVPVQLAIGNREPRARL